MPRGVRNLQNLTIFDTSAWLALVDESDEFHEEAKEFAETNPTDWATTDLVVSETLNVVNWKLGNQAAREIGKRLFDKKTTRVIKTTKTSLIKSWELFQNFGSRSVSFVDCSLMVILEEIGARIFTFDSVFRRKGFKTVP